MNKILVVAKNPETYFVKRLIGEVGYLNIYLYNPWTSPPPPDIYTKILFRSSGIYHSDKDLEFARRLKAEVLNPLRSLVIFRSKSSQYEFFNSQGLPALPWWRLTEWKNDFSEASFLVKPDLGQGGWGIQVFGLRELESWREKQTEKGDLSWIIQPYTKASEYRVFFVGQERYTLLREPAGLQKAANFTQMGKVLFVPMPLHLVSLVEELITKSSAYYGAIDLLDTPSGPKFLELNVVPGIEQLEKITGINIIQRLLSANYFCQIS